MELELEALQMLPADETGLQIARCKVTCIGITCEITCTFTAVPDAAV